MKQPDLFSRHLFFLALMLGCACPSADMTPQWITHHDPVFQGMMEKPPAGQSVRDPHFGTVLRRLTYARAEGRAGIVPQYAKRQAWNANDSLLLLFSGDGRTLLYDGRTYDFLREVPEIGGEDVFWHPSSPNLILGAEGPDVYSFDVATSTKTVLRRFAEYSWINTRGEGNLSQDGRWYAFAGQVYDSTVHFRDLVVYDMQNDRVEAIMTLPQQLADFDWVSISPSGNYVVVDYATTDTGRYAGIEIYDRAFNILWQRPLGSGHSDLTVDALGEEALVMGYYDPEANVSSVRKYRLRDGTETVLIEHDWSLYSHISCRNTGRAGWCFVSLYDGEARLEDDSVGWLPFEDEIFAVNLDGSGAVQRIAHHRSRRFSPRTPDSDNSVYWAEPHATVNAAGTRVLFGSNWREGIEIDSSVDAYIADFRDLLPTSTGPVPLATPGARLILSPNPVRLGERVTITGGPESHALSDFSMFDALGRRIPFEGIGSESGSTPFSFIPRAESSGVYFLRVGDENRAIVEAFVILR